MNILISLLNYQNYNENNDIRREDDGSALTFDFFPVPSPEFMPSHRC